MSMTRDATLARIRAATAAERGPIAAEYASIQRDYKRSSTLNQDQLVELFASRIVHYDGSVLRCDLEALPSTIAGALASRTRSQLHVPADLESSWLPAGIPFVPDLGLSLAELDRSEGVLTGCTVAVAQTGTMILTHAPGEGRRALTLVPDYHLAVVFADQIVETVPEGLQRAIDRSPALITTISGPSATSDIEMTRIKGVHGPRTLDVIIVLR